MADLTDPDHEDPPWTIPYEVVALLAHSKYPVGGDCKKLARVGTWTDSVLFFVLPAHLEARGAVSHLVEP